jgi:hypothetical protein
MGESSEAEEWYRRLASSNSVKELTLLASNYLSLGQFELARATLKLLHDSSPDQAIRYLTRLVTQNVPSAWCVKKKKFCCFFASEKKKRKEKWRLRLPLDFVLPTFGNIIFLFG